MIVSGKETSVCFVEVEVHVEPEPELEPEPEVPLSSEENERPSFIETELFIREEGDPIEPIQQYPKQVERTPSPTPMEEEQPDEEFERNFLRAVDRALGVVNKESSEPLESASSEAPQMDLTQITELAVASVENSSLLTVNKSMDVGEGSTGDFDLE